MNFSPLIQGSQLMASRVFGVGILYVHQLLLMLMYDLLYTIHHIIALIRELVRLGSMWEVKLFVAQIVPGSQCRWKPSICM